MRTAGVIIVCVVVGMFAASRIALTPPLAVSELPEGVRAVTARHFLSNTAEAGKKAFSGSCADCHGAEGLGGSAPALDAKTFTRDFRRSRDLHDAVNGGIPAHAGLDETLGAAGGSARFNDVEKMGKYLRELRLSRQRKEDN